ncbi:hypothetical protein RFI_18595 [Reticulomyxa filosa]|uniref:Uncharacterized protein n=1 Tax=Reticulomyxa filosa TaxID=46433 RepID=X6N015_RETFI|nr:hypothetical protein RFI_18595 [Reticulomyxa filosa]|eukprot:ETO18667.1 hypothetical protein RFI_18595 [Reticulomyxa filosa]
MNFRKRGRFPYVYGYYYLQTTMTLGEWEVTGDKFQTYNQSESAMIENAKIGETVGQFEMFVVIGSYEVIKKDNSNGVQKNTQTGKQRLVRRHKTDEITSIVKKESLDTVSNNQSGLVMDITITKKEIRDVKEAIETKENIIWVIQSFLL